MDKTKFELIFPTPVMLTELGRDFTLEELNFFEKHSHSVVRNVGNIVSSNNQILDEPEMSNLKNFVTNQLNKYLLQVYKPKFSIEIFVTQSWINWTKKGEYHHKHNHPNSFVSGVFYLSADPAKDTITFWRSGYKQLYLEPKTYDAFNSDSWWFKVKTGDIMMFPSSLTHSVSEVATDNVRVSLAFNSFVKGELGDKKLLTHYINR
jgi:uncharacterized protein (TIGR02466 family)